MNATAKPQPKSEARRTLEQQRAQDAWDCAEKARKQLGREGYDKYVDLAKGLPALIMNSGLMQVLAFLHEKSLDKKTGKPEPEDHHTLVGLHLREALHNRFSGLPAEFQGSMQELMDADAHRYQAITAEALAWLRWLRQMAAARHGGI
jgi:CRISPR-associated protein Cmr5